MKLFYLYQSIQHDISYGVLLDGTGQIWMKDIAIEIVSDAVAETGRY